MGVEVRFFKKGEKKLLLEAIDHLWRHDHIYVRNPVIMDHLVLNTPWKNEIAEEDEYSFVGLWIDGEVVGLQGVMPQEANVLGRIVKSQTSTIWVAKRIKGKSVDGMLTDQYACDKRMPSFGLALGFSKRAEKVHKIRGGYISEDVPRWIIINDLKCFNAFFKGRSFVDYCLPLTRIKVLDRKYNIEIDTLDKNRWDDFYFTIMAPRTIGVCRDYKFINWRYFESPVLKYNTIAVRDVDGKYLGLAVIRIEYILDDAVKIGRILEFISFDIEASVELADAILRFDKDVMFWDFYCLSDVTVYGLEAVGFRKIPAWDNKMYLPTRFHPIDNKITKLNCSVILSDDLKEFVEPINISRWYITRGDSDQDRAN